MFKVWVVRVTSMTKLTSSPTGMTTAPTWDAKAMAAAAGQPTSSTFSWMPKRSTMAWAAGPRLPVSNPITRPMPTKPTPMVTPARKARPRLNPKTRPSTSTMRGSITDAPKSRINWMTDIPAPPFGCPSPRLLPGQRRENLAHHILFPDARQEADGVHDRHRNLGRNGRGGHDEACAGRVGRHLNGLALHDIHVDAGPPAGLADLLGHHGGRGDAGAAGHHDAPALHLRTSRLSWPNADAYPSAPAGHRREESGRFRRLPGGFEPQECPFVPDQLHQLLQHPQMARGLLQGQHKDQFHGHRRAGIAHLAKGHGARQFGETDGGREHQVGVAVGNSHP